MDKQKIKTLIEHITLHLDTGRELVEEFADLTGADDYLNDALDALDCAYSDLEKFAKEESTDTVWCLGEVMQQPHANSQR